MGSPPLDQDDPVEISRSPGEWRLSSVGLYVIASGASSVLGLLVVAVLARVLGASAYGLGEAAAAVLVLGAAVALLGLDTSIALAIHGDESGDVLRRRAIAGTATCVITAASVLLAVLVLVFRDAIAATLLSDPQGGLLVGVVAVAMPFVTLQGLAMAIARNLGRAEVFLTLVVVSGCVQVAVSVMAALAGLGPASAVLGTGAGAAAGTAVAMFRLRRSVSLSAASRPMARHLLVLGLPLVPAAVAAWAIAVSDRLLLLAIVDAREVGLYAAAAKVAAGSAVLVSAFTLGWSPYALRIQHRPSAAGTYRDVMTIYTFAAGLVLLASAVLGPLAVTILAGADYKSAGSAVWLLVGGALAYGGYLIVGIGIQIAARTGLIALTSILAAVLNVALNVLLLPVIGYVGAGISTFVAYLVSAGLVFALAQSQWPVPYPTVRLGLTLAVAATGAGVLAFLELPGPGLAFVTVASVTGMAAAIGPHRLRAAIDRTVSPSR